MKKAQTVLLVILLGFNIFLGYEVIQLKQRNSSNVSESGTIIDRKVSEFETDATKVVSKVENKVVSILRKSGTQSDGSGSGVVYSRKDGALLIVTNHHVIDGANEVYVRFSNGEEVLAQVLGSDEYTDLALLKVKTNIDIEPFDLGDSSLTKVGEFVLAIGSPLGVEFSNSTTFGIVSGKDRVVSVDLNNDGVGDWDMIVLQTDAAINPGNSGGALVNMNGELIGINSLKISSSQVEGMGFSIPINEVIPIIKQLEETGKVQYPIVGISALSVSDMNQYTKAYYGVADDASGVYISGITKNSPAEKAGLNEKDLITGFDGEKISDFKSFRKKLYAHKPGDNVTLTVVRDSKELEIKVTLE